MGKPDKPPMGKPENKPPMGMPPKGGEKPPKKGEKPPPEKKPPTHGHIRMEENVEDFHKPPRKTMSPMGGHSKKPYGPHKPPHKPPTPPHAN